MAKTDKKPGVKQYINCVSHPGRREDARLLVKLMQDVTGERPKNWGTYIGYGNYHYRYESGVEGDAPLTAFAARKANMVVYIMPGFSEYGDLLEKLGKHKTGKSCLYLGRMASIDLSVLSQLVGESVELMRRRYKVER